MNQEACFARRPQRIEHSPVLLRVHAREFAIDFDHELNAARHIQAGVFHRQARLNALVGIDRYDDLARVMRRKRRRFERAFVVAAQIADHADAQFAQCRLTFARQLREHAGAVQPRTPHAAAVDRRVTAEVAQVDRAWHIENAVHPNSSVRAS